MKVARRLFFVTWVLTLMTEALPPAEDGVGNIGWYIHADLKSWLPIPIAFNPVELCLIACLIFWFLRGTTDRPRYAFVSGRLLAPVIAFGLACALGVLWGLVRDGDNLTYALFEVRGFGILICAYLLVGMLFQDERDINTLVWCVLVACAGLALENTLRYFLVLRGGALNDLSYDHDDSVILAFGVMLCGALFAFGGTRGQKRFAAVLMPLTFLCLEVMGRRVAFAILGVGFLILAIIFFRLRPKQFWRVVPPLAVVVALYLGAFWNNTSALGQPARAIRSQFTPDPRDASSDLYRVIERGDILQNIATSRIMGLGFGQQYAFFDPLPDLSFWPFWHYTSHNAVLWVWMDGGIPVFFTFFWLLGAGAYQGSHELAARREAWSLRELSLRRPRRSGRPSQAVAAAADGMSRSHASARTLARADGDLPGSGRARRDRLRRSGKHAGLLNPALGTSSLALVVSGVCLVAMQVTYSYVDLGLTGNRTMLLLGTVLGLMGRSFVSDTLRSTCQRKVGRSRALKDRASPPEAAPRDIAVDANAPALLLPLSGSSGPARGTP